MSLNKRELLTVLAALAAGAGPAVAQPGPPLDLAAGQTIGAAYRALYPSEDIPALRRAMLADGASAASIGRLCAEAAADFASGRTFVYQGWILSRTEGRLFALLTT